LGLISFRRRHLRFLFFHETCVESTKSTLGIRRGGRVICLMLLGATGCGRITTPTSYADVLRFF
jgi:hypothetical protein